MPFETCAHVARHIDAFVHFGQRPWTRRVGHVHVPSMEEFEEDATWKDVPREADERAQLMVCCCCEVCDAHMLVV